MYKKPDFPPNFPEELKAEILSKLDKVDKAYEGWKEKPTKPSFGFRVPDNGSVN